MTFTCRMPIWHSPEWLFCKAAIVAVLLVLSSLMIVFWCMVAADWPIGFKLDFGPLTAFVWPVISL